jgi:sugar phosphate isomerase/epimerase
VLWVGNKRVPDPNPGLGQIAWGPFFGILYDAGYGGAVCIEPHSSIYGGENRYRFLVLSGRYLRQFMLPEL